jgi:hypothetical protein
LDRRSRFVAKQRSEERVLGVVDVDGHPLAHKPVFLVVRQFARSVTTWSWGKRSRICAAELATR